jgi:hypothetical protein
MKRRLVFAGAAALLTVFGVGLASVALGGGPTNPAVVQEPVWDSPQTRELAVRAGCFDCHSNQTVWPWYTAIPGVRQVMVDHVQEGREVFNMSRMDVGQEEAHEAGEVVAEGEMPPQYYVLLHPTARLSDAERRALIRGLGATFGGEGGEGGEGGSVAHRGHDEDEDEDDD